MRVTAKMTVLFAGLVLTLAGCTSQQQSPQELREKTAETTATLKSDAKAVAEGVREGWSRDRPLDINHASKDQLLALPGISSAAADRMMADRPYDKPADLVTRHVLTEGEYGRISDRVTAK